MKKYIEALKQKPEHIRRRFSYIFASIFTILILLGWIISHNFDSSKFISKAGNKISTPISSLSASAVAIYDDIKDIIFGSNIAEYNADNIEITAGKR